MPTRFINSNDVVYEYKITAQITPESHPEMFQRRVFVLRANMEAQDVHASEWGGKIHAGELGLVQATVVLRPWQDSGLTNLSVRRARLGRSGACGE